MKYLKDYGILILKFLGFLLGGSIIISIFYYLLFSSKVVTVMGMIYLILLFFIFGFSSGKKAKSKGFIEGIKVGVFGVLLLVFINLIFYQSNFKLARVIYYGVLLFASIFGATLGINTKKE